jgi:hypothetical protein
MSKTETPKHNHNHSCSCDHENVKFCKTCRLVHCLDCKTEWTTKPNYYWYGNYTWPYTNGNLGQYNQNIGYLTTTAGGGVTSAPSQLAKPINLNQLNDGHSVEVTYTPTSTCTHSKV